MNGAVSDLSGLSPVATVAESEGLTLVLPAEQAIGAGFAVLLRAAWITLTVHSDLQAVGLTAAFVGALGRAGIGCNVVAGAYHDHIFVPLERAQSLRSIRSPQAQRSTLDGMRLPVMGRPACEVEVMARA